MASALERWLAPYAQAGARATLATPATLVENSRKSDSSSVATALRRDATKEGEISAAELGVAARRNDRATPDAARNTATQPDVADVAGVAKTAFPPTTDVWSDAEEERIGKNLRAGEYGAKPAKPAKDEQQFGPWLAKALDATGGRADWDAEDWQARFDEHAGLLEHDGSLLRNQAELKAFEHCIVEWLNANPRCSPAGCCTWCGKPETPSAMVLPFGVGEYHAWLHAECWSAWHQSRRGEAAIALRRMGIALGGSLGDHDDD